jgi:hypothetical protein
LESLFLSSSTASRILSSFKLKSMSVITIILLKLENIK